MSSFEETKHPRDKDGKFTDGNGGNKSESEKKADFVNKWSSDTYSIKIMGNNAKSDLTKLKGHYKWAVENGLVSPLVGFAHYKNISKKLKNIAIGKTAVDGTIIKEITFHCIDRVCGTTEKENGVKHDGISIEDFEYTLFNGRVRKNEETNTIIFITEKCRIAINPQRGTIKQCNKL